MTDSPATDSTGDRCSHNQDTFEVSATDPLTYGIVVLLLAVGAAAASWIPAWTVGRVDTVEVLRAD